MSISSDADGNVTVGAPSARGEAKAPLPYGLENEAPQIDIASIRSELLIAPEWLALFVLGEDKPIMYRKEG